MYPIFTKNFKIDFENRKWNYSNRKWDSFSLTICQTYLRHISVNYQANLRRTADVSHVYLRQIKSICQPNQQNLSYIQAISHPYIRNITGIHALYLCNPHASLSPQLYNPVLVRNALKRKNLRFSGKVPFLINQIFQRFIDLKKRANTVLHFCSGKLLPSKYQQIFDKI